MKLSDFTSLLARHENLPFKLLLPGGGEVPQSFHVTEVGHVNKQFVDCGERYHQSNTVQLQAWVGEDEDHRLAAGKLTKILAKAARTLLPPEAEEFPVEIEYENLELTQFRIAGCDVLDGAVVLRLESKHTDCLAKDRCLTPAAAAAASSCCGAGKCC
jgi:hypothetical protein